MEPIQFKLEVRHKVFLSLLNLCVGVCVCVRVCVFPVLLLLFKIWGKE